VDEIQATSPGPNLRWSRVEHWIWCLWDYAYAVSLRSVKGGVCSAMNIYISSSDVILGLIFGSSILDTSGNVWEGLCQPLCLLILHTCLLPNKEACHSLKVAFLVKLCYHVLRLDHAQVVPELRVSQGWAADWDSSSTIFHQKSTCTSWAWEAGCAKGMMASLTRLNESFDLNVYMLIVEGFICKDRRDLRSQLVIDSFHLELWFVAHVWPKFSILGSWPQIPSICLANI
jgi:hypothetical protein